MSMKTFEINGVEFRSVNIGTAIKRYCSGWTKEDGPAATTGSRKKINLRKGETFTITVKRID